MIVKNINSCSKCNHKTQKIVTIVFGAVKTKNNHTHILSDRSKQELAKLLIIQKLTKKYLKTQRNFYDF